MGQREVLVFLEEGAGVASLLRLAGEIACSGGFVPVMRGEQVVGRDSIVSVSGEATY